VMQNQKYSKEQLKLGKELFQKSLKINEHLQEN